MGHLSCISFPHRRWSSRGGKFCKPHWLWMNQGPFMYSRFLFVLWKKFYKPVHKQRPIWTLYPNNRDCTCVCKCQRYYSTTLIMLTIPLKIFKANMRKLSRQMVIIVEKIGRNPTCNAAGWCQLCSSCFSNWLLVTIIFTSSLGMFSVILPHWQILVDTHALGS